MSGLGQSDTGCAVQDTAGGQHESSEGGEGMTTAEAEEEQHPDPRWTGVYHKPAWVRRWGASNLSDPEPSELPTYCAVCGLIKEG